MKTKRHLSLLLLTASLLRIMCFNAQGIGINNGGADPHPSAMLDVDATNKGFLPPRLSTLQRDAIASPATGLVIYNYDRPHMSIGNLTPAHVYYSKTTLKTERLWKNYYNKRNNFVNEYQDLDIHVNLLQD